MMISIKRAYESPRLEDGARFLVDRLWPRGVGKERAQLDGWYKDIAPSNDLRMWFAHDATRWKEFNNRYYAELDKNVETWKQLLEIARLRDITLVYSVRDREHNNAVAL
jgi:uncharacterized protein YeaO (DUF488 family)